MSVYVRLCLYWTLRHGIDSDGRCISGWKLISLTEHRPLRIAIDNNNNSKLLSESHNVCKTISARVFLLSKLRFIVDIDTRKRFFNAHVKSHISRVGGMLWCSQKEVKFSAQKSCGINLSRYNSNYWPEIERDENNESTQKRPKYNKVFSCTRSLTM